LFGTANFYQTQHMKTSLPAIFVLLVAFLFYSCKKNDSDNTVNPPPPPSGQSTQLAAVYFVDTTLAVPRDTVIRYKISYDAQNRPSFTTELDTEVNGDSSYYETETFTYNGNDTNVSKKINYSRLFSSGVFRSIDRDTNYYIYANGKAVYDSLTYSPGYYTDKFVYSGNTILRSGNQVSGSMQAVHQSTIYQTFVNGNNTYQLDTLVGHATNVTNPALFNYARTELSTSYLPNPNPFYLFTKYFFKAFYDYDVPGIETAAAPKSCIAQSHVTAAFWGGGGSSNWIGDLSYTYTFRADGYPVLARRVYTHNGITRRWKMFFVYR
jgi:hypothetical protein